MLKIEELSEDDIRYVCEGIGKNEIKKDFIQNSKWLNELKPGFRSTSLSSNEAVELVIKNCQRPFLNKYLTGHIKKWVDAVEKDISKTKKEGKSEEIALMLAIPKSKFKGNPELFFNLSAYDLPENIKSLIITGCFSMDETDSAKIENTVDSVDYDEFMEIQSEWEKEKAELKRTVRDCESERDNAFLAKENAEKQLSEEQERNDALNSELVNLRKKVEKYIPKRGVNFRRYPYTSLCIVEYDYKGYMRLRRVADIEEDQIAEVGKIDLPEHKRPFRRESDEDDGVIAVWDWNVRPNDNDPTRPFYESDRNNTLIPIEIVWSNDCKDLDELKEKLRSGLSFDTKTQRQLWCVAGSKTQTEGILCIESDYSISNGKYRINEDIIELPIYDVLSSDILNIENIQIYRFFDMGYPKRFIYTKEPIDIVRSIFLSRITRQGMKADGFTISDYQKLKEYITKFNTGSTVEEVSEACNIGKHEAEKMVNDFISRAGDCLTGEDFDSDMLAKILSTNPELLSSVKNKIEDEWKKDNAEKIANAEKELDKLNCEIKNIIREKERYETECKAAKQQIDQDNQALEKQKEIARGVEIEVENRIAKAKTNAAEFIAEMAFTQPVLSNPNNTANNEIQQLYTSGYSTDKELESCNTPDDVIDLLRSELIECGVSNTYAYAFGALLFSAFVHRVPLVVCGVNALEIAGALSIALLGRKPGYLVVDEDFNEKAYECAMNSDDPIIMVENFLSPKWSQYILRNEGSINKYFIGTDTYAENIMIEPLGILDHVIPIFTNPIVDNASSGYHLFGTCDAKLLNRSNLKKTKPNRLIKNMGLNPLAINRYSNLLEDMHSYIDDNGLNNDIMLLILPILQIKRGYADCEAILVDYRDKGYISEDELYHLKVSIGIGDE